MAIEAVVFDVDGVLVEAFVFARMLDEQYGITRERTAPFFEGPFAECSIGKADLREAIQPFLIEWGWPGSVEECLVTWFDADSEVNARLLDVVNRIRRAGYRCHIASTQERLRAEYLREVVGLAAHFDGFHFSCDVGAAKPAAKYFDCVAAAIGKPPSAILFFDDLQVNVEGARAAGWHERYCDDLDVCEVLRRYGIAAAG